MQCLSGYQVGVDQKRKKVQLRSRMYIKLGLLMFVEAIWQYVVFFVLAAVMYCGFVTV